MSLPVKRADASVRRLSDPFTVVMVDLLSIVPYYAAHLSRSLAESNGVRLILASITYSYDPACFERQGVRRHPLLLDLTSRLGFLPAPVRRLLKLGEYLVNILVLS